MLNGFFKRLKRPSVKEEEPLKPIYKLNRDSGMYTISCPYCDKDLFEVYYRRIEEVILFLERLHDNWKKEYEEEGKV